MLALGMDLMGWARLLNAANFRLSPANSNYRILNFFQFWNDSQAKFATVYPNGPDVQGQIPTAIGAADASASAADGNALNLVANAYRVVGPLLELWNPISAGYHARWVDGPAGAEVLVWGVKDAAADPVVGNFLKAPAGGNFRVSAGGLFQWAHATSGKFHTCWLTGADGAAREVIGPGEA